MPCAPLLAAAGFRLRGSFSCCLAGSAGLAAFFGGISCARRRRVKHELFGLTSCHEDGKAGTVMT